MSDLEWIVGSFEAKSHASQMRRSHCVDHCGNQG